MIDFKALSAPFDPDLVSWRIGSMKKDKTAGMALAYIDARVVMDRLDDVCGPAGWQCKYSHANGKTVCDIGLHVTSMEQTDPQGWVWKADGAGDSDIEAEKGALSDAFKRAAVRWGIGRYLYDLPSPWVEVDEWKRIKPAEFKKLGQILREHTRSILDPAPKAPGTTKPDVFAGEAVRDGLAKDTTPNYQVNKDKAVQLLKNTALMAIGTSINRPQLKAWWEEHRDELKKKLSDDEYVEVYDAVQSRRDALPAMAA